MSSNTISTYNIANNKGSFVNSSFKNTFINNNINGRGTYGFYFQNLINNTIVQSNSISLTNTGVYGIFTNRTVQNNSFDSNSISGAVSSGIYLLMNLLIILLRKIL